MLVEAAQPLPQFGQRQRRRMRGTGCWRTPDQHGEHHRMPFDLMIQYVPRGDSAWEMEGPSWLDGATLPFDKSCIREIYMPGYRDRYAPISAGELRAWHNAVWDQGRMSVDKLTDFQKQQLDTFFAHVSKSDESSMYLLHWYEWESGLS